MKKLYISLILLFGFLAFVPQIALGDAAPLRLISKRAAQEIRKAQTKELECFKNKKSTIDEKYTGPNLVYQKVPHYEKKEHALVQNKENRYSAEEDFIQTGSPFTNNRYSVISDQGMGSYGGVIVNCKEYIITNSGSSEGYEVTNVPPGSYLKYIPETKEVQVISSLEAEEQLKILHDKISKRLTIIPIENKKTSATYSHKIRDNSFTYSQNRGNYNSIPDFVIRGMLVALLLTIIIEGIIAIPFGWKFVGLVSLANIITNPALNGIIWHYQITETSTILWLEAAVVLIEWGIFSAFIRKNYAKLLLFAFVANLVSYLTGVFFPL